MRIFIILNEAVISDAFVGLDDNITLSSSTSVYDVAAVIGIHDIIRDTEADEKYFYINETSMYFALEGCKYYPSVYMYSRHLLSQTQISQNSLIYRCISSKRIS